MLCCAGRIISLSQQLTHCNSLKSAPLHRILSRTYTLITELIQTQDELVAAKGGSTSSGGSDESKQLKTQLENLKKQTSQQQQEYNRLADELAAAKGEKSVSKKD